MSQTRTSSDEDAQQPEEGEVVADTLLHYQAMVRKVVQSDLNKRIAAVAAADESRDRDIELFDGLLTDLVSVATEDFLSKVEDASEDGQRSAEVFVFDGSDKFKDTDYSILFLTKGPKKQGQDFYLKMGLLPFMARMYQAVRPFDVSIEYLPESNENIVKLHW